MGAERMKNSGVGFMLNDMFINHFISDMVLPEEEDFIDDDELTTKELMYVLIDRIDCLQRKIDFIFSDNVVVGGRFISLKELKQ